MPGTWRRQCPRRLMGRSCSNLKWDWKTQKSSLLNIQKKLPQDRLSILQVDRRRRESPLRQSSCMAETAQRWRLPPCIVWRCCEDGCKRCMWCYRRRQRRQSDALPAGSVHGSRWSCEAGQRRQAGGTCEQPLHHNNIASVRRRRERRGAAEGSPPPPIINYKVIEDDKP